MEKIFLGGKERSLEFGKVGFLKHLGAITKNDSKKLFENNLLTDPGSAYYVTLKIIHAGLLMACELNNEKPDFTGEDVDQWVSDLEATEIDGIVLRGLSSLSGKTVDDILSQRAEFVAAQ